MDHQAAHTNATSCPENMKTHKLMNQVMARLLSEDSKVCYEYSYKGCWKGSSGFIVYS